MFCFEELKYSSSCIPKCNSFYLIFWGGVISFLTIFIHVSWFNSCQEWGILNPSISLLELSWVIFHLKPSIGNVAICGAYHWSKLSPYPSRWKKFSSLRCSQTSNCFSLVAEFHLKFRVVSISPQQAYSYRCCFSNNFVQSYFVRMLFQIHLW